MDQRYDPKGEEGRMYALWEESGLFRPAGEGAKFTIMMPPPNVTGKLHNGHALTFTVEDALVRFHRLKGDRVLWQPGTDHAGIGTQTVVERELRKEGLDRETLGRDAFIERIWAWRRQSGDDILNQLRRLGASADWSRLKFTLDDDLSRAVTEAFVREYERGLIYRGPYIVNWCPRCGTAISDLEVEHTEDPGHLWTLAYPCADGSGEVLVATTRPETMLGDTAVAVHPDDARYRRLVGKTVRLPLVDREIPIIADFAVDPEFGSGAVKVTPAHSPDDFLIAQRHDLPKITVIGPDARMVNVPKRYAGLTTVEARKAVLEDLAGQGLLRNDEERSHQVGHCERCGTVVEPLISEQWFVRAEPLARPVLRALDEGRIHIYPDRFEKILRQWLENIRDWCISRQIWWGHRIPAWTCLSCRATTVARQAPATCPHCSGRRFIQDPDVLDTWFSSALWPFSTLGWPEDTPDMHRFFPTTVLETGYDILFFWVARMFMQSLELTGQLPFQDVLLHGMVRDAYGRKESKSRGNGVDPLQAIEAHGADALRWALATGSTPGQDIRLSEQRVVDGRNFANKVWNAGRFVIASHVDGFDPLAEPAATRLDLWLEDRLAEASASARERLEAYELGEAARIAHEFFWSDLCDVYLEGVKPRLRGSGRDATLARLRPFLTAALTLLHPFVPFVTEAVYQKAPWTAGLLAAGNWPAWAEPHPVARREIDDLIEMARLARNVKAEAGVAAGRSVPVHIEADPTFSALLEEERQLFETLAGVSLTLGVTAEIRKESLSGRTPRGDVFLPLGGAIDVAAELERVDREIGSLTEDVLQGRTRLANEGFTSRAPAEVVARVRERLAEAEGQLERAMRRRAVLEASRR